MTHLPWFVYDPDYSGMEFYATEAEAKAAAEKALDFWRGEAISDGEWSDEVESLIWGRVYQSVVEVPIDCGESDEDEDDMPQDRCCDFVLADVEAKP